MEPSISRMPTGTITFLFSDIEGSTSRWERNHVGMRAAVRRHDTLLRSAIETNGGTVFKTVGDAFCAAFSRAQDAVCGALAIQRAISAEDFSEVGGIGVRIAVHTGTADERDGDYFGAAVNQVSRLLAIGHGGQILVSGISAGLVSGELPGGIALRDLGFHRLKDLHEPQHVFALVAPDVRADFPALRSLGARPNNLARQLTSFVARESDVSGVASLLERHRLLTVAGTGGIGKTRLALQVGAEVLDRFPDGVWFSELAALSDGALLAGAMAATVGLQAVPGQPVIEALVLYLKNKTLLLILDNCEHLIAPVAQFVEKVLSSCPGVSVLATSREALRVAGEHVYPVPSLPVPDRAETLTAAQAMAYGSIALFSERARAADTHFGLTDDNALLVAEICRRLDGIALAIELAAARLNVLPLKKLAEKLNERFAILTGGSRTSMPRQQTMRALIDWSYDLLSERERELFCRLGVFSGGFSLELAAAVCEHLGDRQTDVLDVLSALIEKSLVQTVAAGDEIRYRLLESIRAYALEKLKEGGAFELTARAHAAACADSAERLMLAWGTWSDLECYVRAEQELENWRAALEWSLASKADVLLGQRLASAWPWAWSGLQAHEGERWITAALQAADPSTPLWLLARLEVADARVKSVFGLQDASLQAARRALVLYERLDDAVGKAWAQLAAGRALVFLQQIAEGETLLEQALRAGRAHGINHLTCSAIACLAAARNFDNDVPAALKLFSEGLSMAKRAGEVRLAAVIQMYLAEAEFHGGDAVAALASAGAALSGCKALNNMFLAAAVLANMAAYFASLGQWSEAIAAARESLAMARERQFAVYEANAVQHLAYVAAMRPPPPNEPGRNGLRRAAQLLGFADAMLHLLSAPRQFTDEHEYEALLTVLRQELGPAETAALMNEGARWNSDDAAREALAL